MNTPMIQTFPSEISDTFSKNYQLGKLDDVEDIAEAGLFFLSDSNRH